jgi:CHASE2 domain-containing sensor protein
VNEQINKAWFPAKRYGYGWSFPNRWQGWAVLAAWALLIVVGTILLRPDRHPMAYVVYDTTVSAALVVVIVAKGERLRWRRGDDSDAKPGV